MFIATPVKVLRRPLESAQQPPIIDAVKATFGLNKAEVIVRSDSHYR